MAAAVEETADDHRTPPPRYTLGEEIANSIIHGVGVVFGIAGLDVLTAFASQCFRAKQAPHESGHRFIITWGSALNFPTSGRVARFHGKPDRPLVAA